MNNYEEFPKNQDSWECYVSGWQNSGRRCNKKKTTMGRQEGAGSRDARSTQPAV
jgi:hypothetical protein